MLKSEFPTIRQDHNWQKTDAGYHCSICRHTISIKPRQNYESAQCIGVPIFATWDSVPEDYLTKTALSQEGLKPAKDQQPVAAKMVLDRRGRFQGHYYPLYLRQDAITKKAATEAQLAALEQARFMAERLSVMCSRCGEYQENKYDIKTVSRKQWIEQDYDNYICFKCKDKDIASQWAKDILSLENALIMDTETTDLEGEIINLAAIDLKGNILLNLLIKPQGKMNPEAEAIHGISLESLKDCPEFPEVYEQIKSVLAGKMVIIYNADFDVPRLLDDCHSHGLESIEFEYDCAMEAYAQYFGAWSRKHQSYTWQKLSFAAKVEKVPIVNAHRALGDCKMTLGVIKAMAKSED